MIARRPPKYHAQRCPCVLGGAAHWHDSQAERARHFVLHQRQARGEIHNLEIHRPVYPLVVNGVEISRYTPDATYFEGECYVVEDTKSPPTQRARDYVMRKRLLKALYGLDVRET